MVGVVEDTAPFFRLMGWIPSELSPGKRIRAFSRAKVYFRGWQESLGPSTYKYQKPDMNYPFWGAKLASMRESNLIMAALVTFLGLDRALQMPHYRSRRW